MATIGIAAVSCGSPAATTEPQITAVEPVETTSATDTTTPTVATSTVSSSTTAAPTPVLAPYWAVPAGVEVAVAGNDGLHVLTGSSDRIISTGVFEDIAADPNGDGWFVQLPEAIRHIGDDGTEEAVVTAEEGTSLKLHDVGLVDGHATVFYDINHPHVDIDSDVADEVWKFDVVTNIASKIGDAGGWESGVEVNFGGGVLAGLFFGEGEIFPTSLDAAGQRDVIDFRSVGLKAQYSDPEGPNALTISSNGDRLSWISPIMTDEGGNVVGYEITIAPTDGSEPLMITLPAGPTQMNDVVDYGDYLLADTRPFDDVGATVATLVDPASRGILVLPVPGPAAATGTWTESPRWAIPSPVTEDVTEQVRALESQWADGRDNFNYAKALADLLLADDATATDDCASTARTFANSGIGDGPFYIELRQFCDDSVAGAWYEVTIVGPQPDGSLTGGASRRVLSSRGVTEDGICV